MTLQQYIDKHGITRPAMASQLGISVSGLIKILRFDRIPRRALMDKIIEETHGEVGYADLLGGVKEAVAEQPPIQS